MVQSLLSAWDYTNNQWVKVGVDANGILRVFDSSSQGATYYGVVTAVPGANQFTIPTLAGLGAGKFNGATNPFYAFVFRDAGGAGAAPQGELQPITGYVTATGVFTTAAFTAAVGVGDEILILNPAMARSLLLSLNVPAADAVLNALAIDVIGNKASTPNYTPNNTSDVIRYLKAILNMGLMSNRPLPSLYEGWQDEAGIDAAVWTVTNPATGAAWARGAIGENLMAYAAPNANENARIRSNQRWVVDPTLYATNKILRRFVLEFEAHFLMSPFFDNTNFFLGLTTAAGDTRASNNIIGFGLVNLINDLQTISDAGGAETVNTGFGENLLLTNKFRIEVSLNSVVFSLNEVVLATHVVNLPDLPMYLNFYAPTGGLGAATIRLGIVRSWMEDIAR
ncbi:MAG: hypothetical protein PHQ43_08545 [Dehalococcoidales bacterium]|nr:hypothetical protein [Dehalococcoidales bacterium]